MEAELEAEFFNCAAFAMDRGGGKYQMLGEDHDAEGNDLLS